MFLRLRFIHRNIQIHNQIPEGISFLQPQFLQLVDASVLFDVFIEIPQRTQIVEIWWS